MIIDSTSKDNRVLPDIRQTFRSGGRRVIHPGRSAFCESRDNEAHACRRAFGNAIELGVFRRAF